MGTPNGNPQEYSRNIVRVCPPGSFDCYYIPKILVWGLRQSPVKQGGSSTCLISGAGASCSVLRVRKMALNNEKQQLVLA